MNIKFIYFFFFSSIPTGGGMLLFLPESNLLT